MSYLDKAAAWLLGWVLFLAGDLVVGNARSDPVAPSGYTITLESGHPWRPPFGLERVGRPLMAVIESSSRPRDSDYVLSLLDRGKEVARQPVSFPAQPPYSATIKVAEYGDQLVLSAGKPKDARRIELARQTIRTPGIDFEAVARSEGLVNPVDLGTILVPHGWLLLGPGQGGGLEIAAFCRQRDEPDARVRCSFRSAPKLDRTAIVSLPKGRKQAVVLRLPEPSKTLDRDVLDVSLENGRRELLAHKSIPVMLVQHPPGWPRFGASYAKLRFDAPISVRDPRTGAYSTLKYEDGWDPALKDVVVSLPGGARFVFWRGSSYIPFWAGKHNTGACYEWAEIISPIKGAVDCVEPLMDKELRYGRVEIVESTAARVHVRWTYQSTDLHYQVWGDEAVEDYYFFPDGFGTRVLTLKSDPANEYEISEFIILTPQGTYPLDVLPETLVDMIDLAGLKRTLRFPCRPGESDDLRKAFRPPTLYRLRLSKQESKTAIYFSPMDRRFPETIFAPFTDRGQIVTPCYWGSHWPLARGNATGWTIDERISVTPCHNSVMSWTKAKPDPVRAAQRVCLDAQGRSRLMSVRTWVWLIGMSDLSDGELARWATSFSSPPSLEVQGGRLDFESYEPRRRAFRVQAQDSTLTINARPQRVYVNPIFELLGAPARPLTVWHDGRMMSPDHYAWDGRTLWIDATIEASSEFRLEFKGVRRG
jgi:hypothetical protein